MPIKGMTDRAAGFPEIGRIRKGGPKGQNKPGPDLTYFRVEFDESEKEAEAKFREIYGDQPDRLRIMIPTNLIDEVWDAWVEAYVAGGQVHRSDGERVFYHVDPLTGDRTVLDGEPLTMCPSKEGKPVAFYIGANGQKKPLYAAPVGRLKVIIPDIYRFAYLTLVTTSQHDIGNISSQLRMILDVHGKIAGVPLIMQRKPRKISVPMPEGKRVRMEKWLISVEADPEWVSAKLIAMAREALPETVEGYLLEPPDVDGAVDGDFRPVWEDDIQTLPTLEAEVAQISPDAKVTKLTGDELKTAAERGDPAATAAVIADANDASMEELEAAEQIHDEATAKGKRPYPPEKVRELLQPWVDSFKGTKKNTKVGKMELWNYARWQLSECFAGDKDADEKCHSVSAYLFGKESSKEWTGAEARAIVKWLNPTEEAGGDLKPVPAARAEAHRIVKARMLELGQEKLEEEKE